MEVGQLVIRRWRLADVEALQRAVSESLQELRPWLAWASAAGSGEGAFLAGSAVGWEQGERFEYGLEDRSGRLIGSMGLMRRIGPGGLELGYWVHSAHTGKGVAKLAAARLTAAALEMPDVDHVEIRHDRNNLPSGAVPAGLGFELVGELDREPLATSDSGHDLIWRLRGEDFQASKARALLAAAERAGPSALR
jgi:RimJ/RimL family protein N-acetyltransferase